MHGRVEVHIGQAESAIELVGELVVSNRRIWQVVLAEPAVVLFGHVKVFAFVVLFDQAIALTVSPVKTCECAN